MFTWLLCDGFHLFLQVFALNFAHMHPSHASNFQLTWYHKIHCRHHIVQLCKNAFYGHVRIRLNNLFSFIPTMTKVIMFSYSLILFIIILLFPGCWLCNWLLLWLHLLLIHVFLLILICIPLLHSYIFWLHCGHCHCPETVCLTSSLSKHNWLICDIMQHTTSVHRIILFPRSS